MIRICGIILAVITFFIAFISLYYMEQDKCAWKRIGFGLVWYVMLAASLSFCLYFSQKNIYIYCSGCILSGYIAFAAWTDHCNRYIYTLPITLILILYVSIYIFNGSVSHIIFMFMFVTVLYVICCHAGSMGKGDMYIIASACMILPDIESVAISLSVAASIFILSHVRKIDWRKMQLRSAQAFVPALAVGINVALII